MDAKLFSKRINPMLKQNKKKIKNKTRKNFKTEKSRKKTKKKKEKFCKVPPPRSPPVTSRTEFITYKNFEFCS